MSKPAKSKGAKPKRNPQRQMGFKPLVALYGLDAGTPRGDAVRVAIGQLGIPVATIGEDQLGCSVGAVMGLMGSARSAKPSTAQAPDVEFMLISGMPNHMLNRLLAVMREAGASVALKAQVTQHNRFWPVHLLISEVAKEHAAMSRSDV